MGNEEDMRIYELAYPATTNAIKLAKSLTETKDDSAVTVIYSMMYDEVCYFHALHLARAK